MSEINFKWYALRVRSRSENKIKATFLAELGKKGISNQVSNIVVAFQKVVKNNKKQSGKRYLGYIFLYFDIKNKHIIETLYNIKGVYGFTGERGWGKYQEPVSIPVSEINHMLGRSEDARNIENITKQVFKEKEEIKIINGPLKGFSGTIHQVFDNKNKLITDVRVFKNRSSRVELNFNQVEKITNK